MGRREKELMLSDGQVLDEIHLQVAPTRQGLVDRAKQLDSLEMELRAREADCDEREGRVEKEYHESANALAAAEARLQELKTREEESNNQRSRLLRRQRDLSGT